MASKSVAKLLLQAFLLVVIFFGLTRVVVTSQGLFAYLELAGLLFLLLLSVVGFAHYKTWGDRAVFSVFLLYVCNLVLVWYFYESLFVVLLLVSLSGFLVSLPEKRRSPPPKKELSAVPSPVRDAPKPAEKSSHFVPSSRNAPNVSEVGDVPNGTKEESKPKAKFTPGKYVASKRSNVYHEPKCEWAKKIQKDRRLWFASREEALDKGYKKHDCVR